MRLCNPAWMHVCLYATTPTLLECGDLSVALCGKCSGRVATTCALHCTLKRAPVHLLLWQVLEIPAGWSWTPPRPLGLVQPVVMRNSEACTIANMRKERKKSEIPQRSFISLVLTTETNNHWCEEDQGMFLIPKLVFRLRRGGEGETVTSQGSQSGRTYGGRKDPLTATVCIWAFVF